LRDNVEPSELDGVETDRRSSAGTASRANDGVTLGEGDSGRGDDTSCALCCGERMVSSDLPAVAFAVDSACDRPRSTGSVVIACSASEWCFSSVLDVIAI
jgi:hypothetical protein